MSSRAGSLRDKNDRKILQLQGNSNEGTSARTRPFSFEEIMLRRQNKKLVVDTKDAEPMTMPDTNPNMSNCPDSDGAPTSRTDSVPVKTAKEDSLKATPRKKEEVRSRKEVGTVKDRGSLDLRTNLRLKSNKSTSSRDRGEITEKHNHFRNRTDEHLKSDFENTYERRKAKVVASNHRYNERDKASQRVGKRKHMWENGDINKSEVDVNISKRKDLKRYQEAEYFERKARKKEPLWPFYKEMPKKRRSRSREHVQERDEKSPSISPRAQKREPYHSTKSGWHHLDADKDRISSNGRHFNRSQRRKSGHSSRLGGYSPRKRRSEAAIKTPSPTNRSPERKSMAWDLPPSRKLNNVADSSQAGFQQSGQAVSPDSRGLSVSASVTLNSQSGQPSLSNLLVNKIVSVDSIQLTQATRPMRRLYVENIPLSVSDKSLMECLNDFLLSSGGTYIEGTKPCISCLINKEKGQAVVEFITPEDATLALAFDGKSFSDSILKVRRPKDFVEAATGTPERSILAIPAVSDIVKDSQHKIFIGGISKSISSDMLKEIVSAFGVLKAYHLKFDKGLNERFAFLEYADQSITLKACAGLNGMKLGGTVLTVAQVDPVASRQEVTERPLYDIPEHVKPLLEKPTQVLKLKNVFNREEFLLLTEPDLEEMLDDIRLECGRFGTVKNVEIIKYSNSSLVVHPEADVVSDMNARSPKVGPENGSEAQVNVDCSNCVEKEHGEELSQDVKDSWCVEVDFHLHGSRSKNDLEQNEFVGINEQERNERPQETILPDSTGGQPCFSEDAEAEVEGCAPEPEQIDIDLEKLAVQSNVISEKADADGEKKHNDANVFEEGSILVEYAREEAACIAAHALHGRLYGDRFVSAGYAPYNLYQTRFSSLQQNPQLELEH